MVVVADKLICQPACTNVAESCQGPAVPAQGTSGFPGRGDPAKDSAAPKERKQSFRAESRGEDGPGPCEV